MSVIKCTTEKKKCHVIQVMKYTGHVNKLYYTTALYYGGNSHW